MEAKPRILKVLLGECSKFLWRGRNFSRLKQLWPPLFLELFMAISLSVAYFFLIQKYAQGVPNNSTNLWVFSGYSVTNFHPTGDSWAGRLGGLLFSGFLFDCSIKEHSLNLEQYSNIFGLYHALWLFLLFIANILTLRNSLLVNLGVFSGLIYNFSPAAGFYFYPWDMPSTLFFTLAILFFERRQMLQMLVVICAGSFFKETILVCAILLFFVEQWKWWSRLFAFAGVVLIYVTGKKILTDHLHLHVAALSMNDAKDLHDLLTMPERVINNIKFILHPTTNHSIFANAGTIIAVLALGWQRRFLPYMLVIIAFLGGQFIFGALNEFRIFMDLLPLSLIILAERWQDYNSQPASISATTNSTPAKNKLKDKNIRLSFPATPWGIRETSPILTWLAVLVVVTAIAIPSWQYFCIIDTRRPDHLSRIVEDLTKKAEKGDAQSQFQLAEHYLSGEGVAINQTNAFNWLFRAAEQGIAQAQYQLGVRYAKGEGTERDFGASLLWFLKAAVQGNADAQYNLGQLYENGLGVKQDISEATIWYRRAGEKGNVSAQNALAVICCNLQKDYSQGAEWFCKAAKQGNGSAQNSLGLLYLNGLGLKQDANEAMKWFQLAAQQGQLDGQLNCGLLFLNTRDFNQAAQWLHKAADQGNAQAQYNLAQLYQKGLGVPLDFGEAYLWNSRSAKQGYSLAQLALGKLYFDGQGVKSDKIEAYKLFKLSQLQKVTDAEKELTNCAATMSQEQINTAENELKQLQLQTPK